MSKISFRTALLTSPGMYSHSSCILRFLLGLLLITFVLLSSSFSCHVNILLSWKLYFFAPIMAFQILQRKCYVSQIYVEREEEQGYIKLNSSVSWVCYVLLFFLRSLRVWLWVLGSNVTTIDQSSDNFGLIVLPFSDEAIKSCTVLIATKSAQCKSYRWRARPWASSC